jgi:transcription elongation factor GreB
MSKAFTRESDDEPEPRMPWNVPRPSSALPVGTRNFMTPRGAARLRAELACLVEVERPVELARAAQSGNKRPLQILSERIAQIEESLQSAEVIAPPDQPLDEVSFGAAVTVRNRDGETMRYRIVGADEAEPDEGDLSWVSPLARGLLNARTGERVRVKIPAGEIELEILAVSYDPEDRSQL